MGYRLMTSCRYIDQSLKEMDMGEVQSCEHATEEPLPEALAGLYRRVTGRLVCVAGQRPDAQQAAKELARGMRSPTNTRWARLKRVMRYLLNKRTSIWKFEPTASEARDNELTAASDSDCGGGLKTRKKAQLEPCSDALEARSLRSLEHKDASV